MSKDFDPYYKWLGIPREEQLLDHYRLLGITRLESEAEVIRNAADMRMLYLKTFDRGKHSAESQALLNKVSRARVCLLNGETKQAYDDQLQLLLTPGNVLAEQPTSNSDQALPSIHTWSRSHVVPHGPCKQTDLTWRCIAMLMGLIGGVIVAGMYRGSTSPPDTPSIELLAITNKRIVEGNILEVPLRVEPVGKQHEDVRFFHEGPGRIHGDVLRWQTGEEDGGRRHTITVFAASRNATIPVATTSFTAWVDEAYDPPVVQSVSRRVAKVGEPVIVHIPAEDSDTPPVPLLYELDGNSPAGARVYTPSGRFTFTPSVADAGRLISATVIVSEYRASQTLKTPVTIEIDVLPINVYRHLDNALRAPAQVFQLDVSNSRLRILPAGIGKLKALVHLDVSHNHIVSVIPTIGELNDLHTVDLSRNEIREVPSQLSSLSELRVLDISNNDLATVPTCVGGMERLEELYLSGNRIDTVPAEIGNAFSLRMLDLRGNQIKSVPTQIGNLVKLERLDLRHNRLAELPDEIRSLRGLKELDLRDNPIVWSQMQQIKEWLPNTTIKGGSLGDGTGKDLQKGDNKKPTKPAQRNQVKQLQAEIARLKTELGQLKNVGRNIHIQAHAAFCEKMNGTIWQEVGYTHARKWYFGRDGTVIEPGGLRIPWTPIGGSRIALCFPYGDIDVIRLNADFAAFDYFLGPRKDAKPYSGGRREK